MDYCVRYLLLAVRIAEWTSSVLHTSADGLEAFGGNAAKFSCCICPYLLTPRSVDQAVLAQTVIRDSAYEVFRIKQIV